MEVSQRDGVTLIQLTGGSATQSFSREFLPKIRDAVMDNIGCKAIVITGEGKFFSAGADIKAFQKSIDDGDSVELIRELTDILHPMLVKMRTSKTIFVAALNGASAGGGLGLALACDARIASPNGKMAASYSGIGLSPDGGTTWLLPRLVGEQVARRFFLENQVWNEDSLVTAGDKIADDFSPISDHRGTSGYRLTLATNLLRRLFWDISVPNTASDLSKL